LKVPEISERRESLLQKARSRKLRPEDFAEGTFTISNLGMFGVDAFNAIINAPQAAILAVGRIADRVVPLNGQPAIQPMMILSLSCDHRIVDGARAAQFLQTLVAMLEEPLELFE
jgi:pyruvate dehydrogenase E2 component (dihydrolipoamide acetyltransferase)